MYFNKAVEVVNDAYIKLTEFHFEERDKLNGLPPGYEEVTKRDSEWILLPASLAVYHDNGHGRPELKFINPDGRQAVFDGDTLQPVTDPKYKATYNYVTPAPLPENNFNIIGWGEFGVKGAGHFITDMLPYYLTGSRNERNQ